MLHTVFQERHVQQLECVYIVDTVMNSFSLPEVICEIIIHPLIGEQSIVMAVSVCLSACFLSVNISLELHI